MPRREPWLSPIPRWLRDRWAIGVPLLIGIAIGAACAAHLCGC